MELFENDEQKVKSLDQIISKDMGFEQIYMVSGQTYSRKLDSRILSVLASIAESAHKFTNDLRLLQHLKEIEEPFEKSQIGSSAMAYKRNPMRSERISSIAKYILSNSLNPRLVSSTQWFERTLDDSANKRLAISETFLACDGMLDLYDNVVDGLVVYPKVIEKHLLEEMPFMATENILMDAVKKGGDRQELHEKIRELSMQAGKNVKEHGLNNNLLDLIVEDSNFDITKDELAKLLDPSKYIGRSIDQVEDFLQTEVYPILEANKDKLGKKTQISI